MGKEELRKLIKKEIEKERCSIKEMVKELNVFVDKSLTITCFGNYWAINSYYKGTFFFSIINEVTAPTFKEVVVKAYELMQEEKERAGEK